VTCLLGTLAVRGDGTNGPVQVMIRPEQIKVHAPGDGRVAARVAGRNFYGPETVLHLELLDGSATVLARTFDDTGTEVGDGISVLVDGPVTVFPA